MDMNGFNIIEIGSNLYNLENEILKLNDRT